VLFLWRCDTASHITPIFSGFCILMSSSIVTVTAASTGERLALSEDLSSLITLLAFGYSMVMAFGSWMTDEMGGEDLVWCTVIDLGPFAYRPVLPCTL
jgi:hypothetical protein